MSTPIEIRKMVNDIRAKGVANITEEDLALLCACSFESLPKPAVGGKKCTYCSFPNWNRRKKCINCHTIFARRVYTTIQPIKSGEISNLCNGICQKELLDGDANILECNHRFCDDCMRYRLSSRFITCCFCDSVIIPESIRNKFK